MLRSYKRFFPLIGALIVVLIVIEFLFLKLRTR